MKTIGTFSSPLPYAGPTVGGGRGGATRGLFGGWRRLVMHPLAAFLAWQERARQRALMASLNDHLLRDVGLSRADVERELSKPFWRA